MDSGCDHVEALVGTEKRPAGDVYLLGIPLAVDAAHDLRAGAHGCSQFRLLAENELDDGFMSSAAVVGEALYLRTRTHLYRIEE